MSQKKGLEKNWLQNYVSISNALRDSKVILLIGFFKLRATKNYEFYLFIYFDFNMYGS